MAIEEVAQAGISGIQSTFIVVGIIIGIALFIAIGYAIYKAVT